MMSTLCSCAFGDERLDAHVDSCRQVRRKDVPRPCVRSGGGTRLDDGCRSAGSSAMPSIWGAAREGDVNGVERYLGQDPVLLNARLGNDGPTPLVYASDEGHVGVVRLLLDKGGTTHERWRNGHTALWSACSSGHSPVVRLLLERGVDPAIASLRGWIPSMAASSQGHVEVVRILLGHSSATTLLNRCGDLGEKALFLACYWGHAGAVRALLESGAEPTIASNGGITPMAIAKDQYIAPALHPAFQADLPSAEGRRECVAALEVRSHLPVFLPLHLLLSAEEWGVVSDMWQDAERVYLLWKARQISDQQGSGAVAVEGGQRGEEGRALVDWVVHGLKGDLFSDVMEMMG
jgi:hypothetical protein